MASIASTTAAAARRACGCHLILSRYVSPTIRDHEARLHDPVTVEAMLAIALFARRTLTQSPCSLAGLSHNRLVRSPDCII